MNLPTGTTGWRTKYHTTDCARNTFLLLQKHLTSGTELIFIGWKIVPNEEHFQCDHRFASQPLTNEPLHSSQLFDTSLQKRVAQLHYVGPELRYIVKLCHALSEDFSTQVFRKRAAQLHYVGPELRYISWAPLEARKCSADQGPHSEVVPRAF